MDLAVVGLGAVGTVIAVAAARAGLRVAGVSRSLRGCRGGSVSAEPLGAAQATLCGWDSAATLEPRAVVYAVKSYSLREAVEASLGSGWHPGLAVAAVNGLGGLEFLEEAYGAGRAAQAVVYFGSVKLSTGRARLLGRWRRLLLGCRRPPCSPLLGWLASALRRGGLEALVEEYIEPWRWLKLAVNAAINPVTVIAWAPNGVIVEDGDARMLAEALAGEAGEAAAMEGVELPRDPVAEALAAAEATRDNCSSMLQDAAAGRPLELDAINGAVARVHRRHGGRAAFNEAVAAAARLAAAASRGRRLPCETL